MNKLSIYWTQDSIILWISEEVLRSKLNDLEWINELSLLIVDLL